MATAGAVHLSLPLHPASVPRARRAVEALARDAGVCELALCAIGVAVSEGCTNVVVHAYCDREPGPFALRAEVDDERRSLQVRIRDRGRGMRPRSDSPGLGLGLPLMAALSDRLDIDGADEFTEVSMSFALDRPPAALTN